MPSQLPPLFPVFKLRLRRREVLRKTGAIAQTADKRLTNGCFQIDSLVNASIAFTV